eukprot:7744330-Pyramimonas_sp.AAC.1
MDTFKGKLLDDLIKGAVEQKAAELDARETLVHAREETLAAVFSTLATHADPVQIKVGSRLFDTTRSLLLSHPDSLFHGLLLSTPSIVLETKKMLLEKRSSRQSAGDDVSLDEDWCALGSKVPVVEAEDTASEGLSRKADDAAELDVVRKPGSPVYFVDRDGDVFHYVLEYFRYGD